MFSLTQFSVSNVPSKLLQMPESKTEIKLKQRWSFICTTLVLTWFYINQSIIIWINLISMIRVRHSSTGKLLHAAQRRYWWRLVCPILQQWLKGSGSEISNTILFLGAAGCGKHIWCHNQPIANYHLSATTTTWALLLRFICFEVPGWGTVSPQDSLPWFPIGCYICP